MVQVGEGAKELGSAAHLVANHKPTLSRALDGELFDHGAVPFLHIPHDLLVDLERILGRLLQENSVGDGTDVGSSTKMTDQRNINK